MMIVSARFDRQYGVSLIELMIAMLIAGLLILGITSLFTNTSNVNRMENGLARLQENGRFAVALIQQDIKMATATAGMRKTSGDVLGRIDPDTSLLSLADMGAAGRSHHGLPGYYPGATDRYYIPRSYMLRGYRCDSSSCTPDLGDLLPGDDLYGGGLPAAGLSAGARAQGSDVLTLRYQRDLGVPIRRGSTLPLAEGGATIALDEPLQIGPSRLVIVSDYQTSIILSVQETGVTSTLTPAGNISTDPNGLSALQGLGADRRVADFDASLVTVTYYLGLVEDQNGPNRLISSLFRRENGNTQEIAQGIERLDFLFHIEDVSGQVAIHTAQTVAGLVSGAGGFRCIKLNPDTNINLVNLDQPVCQWRSVRAVDIHLLANTVSDAGSHQEPFVYSFMENGSLAPPGTVQLACDPAFGTCPAAANTELPSGLPPGRMMRREFQTTAVIRNAAF